VRELSARDVLADLFGSGDFPGEVFDTLRGAEIVIQRLLDAGFAIVDAKDVRPLTPAVGACVAAVLCPGPPFFFGAV
jgi:hypothetical protein